MPSISALYGHLKRNKQQPKASEEISNSTVPSTDPTRSAQNFELKGKSIFQVTLNAMDTTLATRDDKDLQLRDSETRSKSAEQNYLGMETKRGIPMHRLTWAQFKEQGRSTPNEGTSSTDLEIGQEGFDATESGHRMIPRDTF